MHTVYYTSPFNSAPALHDALPLDAPGGLHKPPECSDCEGRSRVGTDGRDGKQGVIAAAIEACAICKVHGEGSHLCPGLMEEAACRLGLEGWAGIHFAMMMSKQQNQRHGNRNFEHTFKLFCLN